MSRSWYSGQLAHVSGRRTRLPLMIVLMQLFGGGGSQALPQHQPKKKKFLKRLDPGLHNTRTPTKFC